MLPEQQEGKIREDREATVEGRMMSSLIENGKNEEGWQMGLLDLPTGGWVVFSSPNYFLQDLPRPNL